MRRLRVFFGGLTLILCSAAVGAAAQSLTPGKPIRIVVPVAPGVATDILARTAGEWLQKRTGHTVIVENRTGAGGNIALQQVAKAEPDGHTLLVATNGAIAINPALYKNTPVDSAKDIAPVAMLANVPQLLTINGNLPAKNARELIALAKAKPGG